MDSQDEERPPATQVRQEATAYGRAVVNQAGRDLHLHLRDGVDGARRTVPRQGGPDGAARECPYPGLAPLTEAQQDWFFGRDKALAQLVGLVDERVRRGGVQMVIAPSGAGKTSLLHAGLLGKISQGALPGSQRWRRIMLTPTAEPMAELSRRLGHPGFGPPDPGAFRGAGERALIVVDQFEELFTQCADRDQRARFADALVRLASPDRDGRHAVVVVAVRADFYAACVDLPPLRPALGGGALVVGPMSGRELREVILYPAEIAGLTVEPGLVELLLADLGAPSTPDAAVGYESGRLPLLAHALRSCWLERSGSTLTVEGYRATGGIEQAVARTAERAYTDLSDDDQAVARGLFLRLVRIGDGTADTRRRPARGELVASAADPVAAGRVLERFVEARLLAPHDDTVELIHEALLRSWPRLRRWIDDNRGGRLTLQALEETATAWQSEDRDAARLYRGSRLDTVQRAVTDPALDPPSPLAAELLTASRRARRRGRLVRTVAVCALVLLAAAASGAAFVAYGQRTQAVQQRDTAVYNRVVAESVGARDVDASLAAQLDLVADHMQPSGATYARLVEDGSRPLSDILEDGLDTVRSIAYRPDGKAMAYATAKRQLRLLAPAGQSVVTTRLDGQVVAFARGNRLMAVGRGQVLDIYDVRAPARPRPVGSVSLSPSKGVDSLTFSPDGRTIATETTDGYLRLWNVADPTHPRALGEPLTGDASAWGPKPLSFSADGELFAAAVGIGVQVWDVARPASPRIVGEPLPSNGEGFTAVAFSPVGRGLAVANIGSSVYLWDLKDAARPRYVGVAPATGSVGTNSLAFDATGQLLAGAQEDQTVMLWNVSDLRNPQALGTPLTGHTGAVLDVAFHPAGGWLSSVSAADGTVREWQLPSLFTVAQNQSWFTSAALVRKPEETVVASTSDGRVVVRNSSGVHTVRLSKAVTAVAVSPDGATVAASSSDGTVRLWSAARLKPVGKPLTGHVGRVVNVAYRPDGRLLASAGTDGTVRLWSLAEPARPRALGGPLKGHTDEVFTVAFSPDGRLLASAGMDAVVRLWDVADPAHPHPLAKVPVPAATSAWAVAFSPSGRTLAASVDTTVSLFDVSDPAHPRMLGGELTGHTADVMTLAFSPDGGMLATAGADSTVRLWDVSDPAAAAGTSEVLQGHGNRVTSVRFSPDGRNLITASRDQTVRFWQVNRATLTDRLCGVTKQALTPGTWQEHVSDELPYQPPCP